MGGMSASDAAPLPRMGEVFFDVRGSSRSMRLSWYADTQVAVFSIWQGGMCTGTFRLPMADLPRMIDTLRRGPSRRQPRDRSSARQRRTQGPAGRAPLADDLFAPGPARGRGARRRADGGAPDDPAGPDDAARLPRLRGTDDPAADYPAGIYPAAAGYPADDGHPAEADYPAAEAYPPDSVYLPEESHPADADYPSADYRPEAGYPAGGHTAEPDYPAGGVHAGPDYPADGGHPGEAGYAAEERYLTEADYPEPDYPAEPDYIAEPYPATGSREYEPGSDYLSAPSDRDS
jgi:hypothetical protein